ncbi:MAG TPA: cysteine--tRNA ligase, partial [Flavobacteriales bacterium]|nr:cysteine--tRNA ligase [Flavobacteriales bacterium]
IFPHHECEIAQAEAEKEKDFARYWMHNNMVTINGQKMGKSLGNGVFLYELFSGDNKQLDKAYSPMTVRFFILMSHYRSTLDFSNEALGAAEKGLDRLMNALGQLDKIRASETSSLDVGSLKSKAYEAMNDDFNTPILIAHLFEGGKWINLMLEKKESLTKRDLEEFKTMMVSFTFDVLGLKPEAHGNSELVDELMSLILDIRKLAKENKNYELSDKIRDDLNALKIEIRDGAEGSDWKVTS